MPVKCIIPAAGAGVRFHELGRQYPKAILPYKSKPLLVHNLEILLAHPDVVEIDIVVGHLAEKIEYVLQLYFPAEIAAGRVRIAPYLGGPGRHGPAMSIASALDTHETEILIVLGDILLDPESDLLAPQSYVSVRSVPDWQRWCMVSEVDGVLDAFYDKAEERPPTDLALTGIYYLKDGALARELINAQIEGTADGRSSELEISEFLALYALRIPTRVRADIRVKDFGTLEEYLEKREVPASRSFNELSVVAGGRIRKSSNDPDHAAKIIREIAWYRLMPASVQGYLPRLFDYGIGADGSAETMPHYTLERVFAPTLRDFYIFLESDATFWTQVFEDLRVALETFQASSPDLGTTFWTDLSLKNRTRIGQLPDWADCGGFAEEFDAVVAEMTELPRDTLAHGDLCLSNILYDPVRRRLTFVDPSGSIVGNVLYDLAKLMQCLVYGYDFIDAELYSVNENGVHVYDDGKAEIRAAFSEFLDGWLSHRQVQFVTYLTACLYLTMIPLHAHSELNQRLYLDLFLQARADSRLAKAVDIAEPLLA